MKKLDQYAIEEIVNADNATISDRTKTRRTETWVIGGEVFQEEPDDLAIFKGDYRDAEKAATHAA